MINQIFEFDHDIDFLCLTFSLSVVLGRYFRQLNDTCHRLHMQLDFKDDIKFDPKCGLKYGFKSDHKFDLVTIDSALKWLGEFQNFKKSIFCLLI